MIKNFRTGIDNYSKAIKMMNKNGLRVIVVFLDNDKNDCLVYNLFKFSPSSLVNQVDSHELEGSDITEKFKQFAQNSQINEKEFSILTTHINTLKRESIHYSSGFDYIIYNSIQ